MRLWRLIRRCLPADPVCAVLLLSAGLRDRLNKAQRTHSRRGVAQQQQK